MLIKLPGRTLASAGMKSPPELASKIVTPRRSPIPKRRSLGRLRSGNSPTSLGAALAKMSATLGVIRTKAYGIFLGSCCPAHTSQLAGPVAGIKAQPPTARCDIRSAKLNRIRAPRTVAPSPRNFEINASDCVRSTNLLSGIVWNWLSYWTLVAETLHRWTRLRGSGNTTPDREYPTSRGRDRPPPMGANRLTSVLDRNMAVGTLMSPGSVYGDRCVTSLLVPRGSDDQTPRPAHPSTQPGSSSRWTKTANRRG